MNTRRYPRTMAEAFGPYTSPVLHSKPDPAPARDWPTITYLVILVATVVLTIFVGVPK